MGISKMFETPLAKAFKYLEDRGITRDTMDACGFKIAGRDECLAALHRQEDSTIPWEVGIILPLGENGSLQVAWVKTIEPPQTFHASIKHATKTTLAGKHAALGCFVSPYDWGQEAASDTLYLCESPIKAASLWAHANVPTVGGTGVAALYARRRKSGAGFADCWPDELIDRLKHVVVLFDSDTTTNPDVAGAVKTLQMAIEDRYPDLEVSELRIDPALHGEKVGIDDLIVKHGDAWLADFLTTPRTKEAAKGTRLQTILDELNARYVFIESLNRVFDIDTGTFHRPAGFKELEARRNYVIPNGDRVSRTRPAEEWLEWPQHTRVSKVSYEPGYPQVQDGFLNLYTDDSVDAVEGDVQVFLDTYANAVPDPVETELLWDCLAWVLQNPTKKLGKMFYFVGATNGTGKSLLGEMMGDLVGRGNFAPIGTEDLEGAFNSHYSSKQFVMLDDVEKLSRKVLAKVRRMVTSDEVSVNTKGMSQYTVKNKAVLIFTSNVLDAVQLTTEDRRTLVITFKPKQFYPSGHAHWNSYGEFLKNDGAGKVKHWLLNRDLTDFDPNFMPPMTKAKRELVSAVRDDIDQFMLDVQRDPDSVLPNARSVFTPDEVWMLACPDAIMDASGKAKLGRKLQGKFSRANDGRQIRMGENTVRCWVLRAEGGRFSLAGAQDMCREDMEDNPIDFTTTSLDKY